MKKILAFSLILLFSTTIISAQVNPFLENFRVGFGAGVNFSHIMESRSYSLYEDLTGAEYKNTYSGMFKNFGHQYFVQVDYRLTGVIMLRVNKDDNLILI